MCECVCVCVCVRNWCVSVCVCALRRGVEGSGFRDAMMGDER